MTQPIKAGQRGRRKRVRESMLLGALYADMCPHCAGLTEFTELHDGRYHTEPGVDPGWKNERCYAADLRARIERVRVELLARTRKG